MSEFDDKLNPDLGFDSFGKPRMMTANEAKAKAIISLLFMRPGQNPSHPTMGINVKKYLYMFYDDINVTEVKAEIGSQCEEFLEDIQAGDIEVVKQLREERPMLVIIVPTITDDSNNVLAVGVTNDNIGNTIYNYAFVKNAI